LTTRHRILRTICVRPCTTRDFTTAAAHLALPERQVEMMFAELIADGLAEWDADGKLIATAAGVGMATKPTDTGTARYHCNFSQPNYTPPKWEPVRAGADAHKAHRSHGVGT
jgi:hypothetical protein